jgi:hypothetical protein
MKGRVAERLCLDATFGLSWSPSADSDEFFCFFFIKEKENNELQQRW